jgi:ribosomal protein S18 acetylase RimI-like enzyme
MQPGIISSSTPAQVEIEEGPARIDIGWTFKNVRPLYEHRTLTEIDLIVAIHNGICFGAYRPEGQIGFIRMVTDRVILSTIAEIVVDSKHRREGIGEQLVRSALAHHYIAGTTCVVCSRRAPRFFELMGFEKVNDWVAQRSVE